MKTTRRMGGLALIVAAGVAVTARPAGAQVTPGCRVAVDGRGALTATVSGDAIPVDVGGRITVLGLSPVPATSVRVEFEFPLMNVTVLDQRLLRPGRLWVGTVAVSDFSRFGVGLYHVRATADGCVATAWIDVQGRSPLTTVAGVAAVAVAALGVILLLAGLVRGARGRGGLVASMGGGLLGGVGGLVLTQQFGLVPVTGTWLALWAAGPVALGGVSHAGLAALSGRGAGGRSTGRPAEPSVREVEPSRPEAEPSMATAEHPATTAEFPATRAEAPPPAAPPPGAEAPATATIPPMAPERPVTAMRSPVPPPDVPDRRDPPRSAFALLECPEAVVAQQPFELTVGLAPQPAAGVIGGPMTRPASSVGPYTLSVQVVADGFGLLDNPDPGGWRRDLQVTADAPYPAFVMHLVPEAQDQPIRAASVQAIYSVDGQTIGMAVRSVAVARSADLAGQATVQPQESGTDISIPTDLQAPDLTVRILLSGTEGRLLWTFETPHQGIGLPDAPVVADIGTHPEAFTRQMVDQIGVHEGQPGLYQYLNGIGLTVADQVPQEFWDLLRAVAARAPGRPPLLLLLSQEPYVPWELAVMDGPLFDPQAPPFLSAQTTVGRWVLGHRRPKLPPPLEVQVADVAVVWGEYDRQDWRLFEAEDEAKQLRTAYHAESVTAEAQMVLDCLQGTPPAQLLHFALHGIYNPGAAQEGLVLIDGRTLDPMEVKGATMPQQPFVFLNACQVGAGAKVLGDYAGMAEAFLYAGASGVVAPLWSINDSVAKGVALRFYQRTLAEGITPADVFRTERAAFRDGGQALSATYLAYQFFGHPAMRLARPS